MKNSLSLFGCMLCMLFVFGACSDAPADPSDDRQPAVTRPSEKEPTGAGDDADPPSQPTEGTILPLSALRMPSAHEWLEPDNRLRLFRSEEELTGAAGEGYGYMGIDFDAHTVLAIHLTTPYGIHYITYALTENAGEYTLRIKVRILATTALDDRALTLLAPRIPDDAPVACRIEFADGYDVPDGSGILPLSTVEIPGKGEWLGQDNTLRVYRSEAELRAAAGEGYFDPGFDFDRYTLLTLNVTAPNGIRYVTYSLSQEDGKYAFRAKILLSDTAEVGQRFLALLAPKIPAEAAIESEVQLSHE